MPRDDSKSEQLWQTVLARKRKGSPERNGHAAGEASGSARDVDSLLVDALYNVLREESSSVDSTAARLRLQQAIRATSPAPAAGTRPIRSAWAFTGRRQLLLAAALILITATALAYILWSCWPQICGAHSAPTVNPSLPEKLHQRLPEPGAKRPDSRSSRGSGSLIPVMAASMSSKFPKMCP
jgi:hypothetical protein